MTRREELLELMKMIFSSSGEWSAEDLVTEAAIMQDHMDAACNDDEEDLPFRIERVDVEDEQPKQTGCRQCGARDTIVNGSCIECGARQ